MTFMTDTPRLAGGLAKRLPLIIILAVAAIGAFTLRDYLSFQALADNRETLIAFRDANYLLTVLAFICAYVVIVGFSLPGASIATLTGGFLFATFPGALFNITGATIGATAIFMAGEPSAKLFGSPAAPLCHFDVFGHYPRRGRVYLGRGRSGRSIRAR